MSSPVHLRVVFGGDDARKLSLMSGIPASVDQLVLEIKTASGLVQQFRLQYKDADFGNEYVNLTSTSDTLKVVFFACEETSSSIPVTTTMQHQHPTYFSHYIPQLWELTQVSILAQGQFFPWSLIQQHRHCHFRYSSRVKNLFVASSLHCSQLFIFCWNSTSKSKCRIQSKRHASYPSPKAKNEYSWRHGRTDLQIHSISEWFPNWRGCWGLGACPSMFEGKRNSCRPWRMKTVSKDKSCQFSHWTVQNRTPRSQCKLSQEQAQRTRKSSCKYQKQRLTFFHLSLAVKQERVLRIKE